ncbi:MAG: hypothetical protein ACKO5E_15255 [bacterium]
MNNLDQFFKLEEQNSIHNCHPLIRKHIKESQEPVFDHVKVRIHRPRAVFGFESAQIQLCYFDSRHDQYALIEDEWDFDLNITLLLLGIRAFDKDNEIIRFGLNFNSAFQHVESRFGDGFFNSALIEFVRESPFAEQHCIKDLFPYIKTLTLHGREESMTDCKLMIQEVLQDQWLYLRRKLDYTQSEAEPILAGAIAYYLDERFGITDGRRLGWLKG